MASVNAPLLKQPFIQPKAVTASRTLTGADSGTAWCNTNATASITFTLPLAAVGLTALATGVLFQFLVSSATETIVITPKTGDTIRGQTTSASLTLSTEGSFVQLECLTPGFWEVITGNVTGGGGGSGTVTSVGAANSDGLIVITGTNPVTTTGTIDFNLSSGAAADLALAATALQGIFVADSVTGAGTSGSPLELSGDSASPGATMLYGTNASSTKGWYPQSSGGSAETTFTQAGGTSQVYTVPASANFVYAICIGGGGGGGGAGFKAAGQTVGGGGGGQGGGISIMTWRAADLGASVAVTFGSTSGGTGGGGGNAATGGNGIAGTPGTFASFGPLMAYGGNPGGAGSSGAGAPGTGTGQGSWQAGTNGGAGGTTVAGVSGGNLTTGSGLVVGCLANTGGGGGGGVSTTTIAVAGGSGGSGTGATAFYIKAGGAAGASSAGVGSIGGNGPSGAGFAPAMGGGGGGGSTLTNPGVAGGNGGSFGGGGGGGGGSQTTAGNAQGGNGGNGGLAAVIVLAW